MAGSPLSSAELVEVDGLDGTGLDELRLALDRLVAGDGPAIDDGRPRLWIDRSFAVRGAGTVVTGTLAGGALAVDDEVVVSPRGARARIRSLQTHGASRAEARPGERVAVNLSGIAHEQVARGDALVRPGAWHESRTVDASLEVLAALDHPVSRRGAYVAYIGSGEHPAQVRVLGDGALAPGERGLVRLHLPLALPLQPGDRYVLRDSGRRETIGGGEILDVAPVVKASRAQPDRSVERMVAERGWIDVDELARLTGTHRPATVGRWVVDPAVLAAEQARLRALIGDAGPLGLDVSPLDERERAVLEALPEVRVMQGRVTPGPADDPLAGHPYVAGLEAEPFTPPPPDDVDRGELRELVRRGLVIEEGGIHFAPASVDQAAETIATLLEAHPEGVTVGQVREALGTIPQVRHPPAAGARRHRPDAATGRSAHRRPRLLAARPDSTGLRAAVVRGPRTVVPGRRPHRRSGVHEGSDCA